MAGRLIRIAIHWGAGTTVRRACHPANRPAAPPQTAADTIDNAVQGLLRWVRSSNYCWRLLAIKQQQGSEFPSMNANGK